MSASSANTGKPCSSIEEVDARWHDRGQKESGELQAIFRRRKKGVASEEGLGAACPRTGIPASQGGKKLEWGIAQKPVQSIFDRWRSKAGWVAMKKVTCGEKLKRERNAAARTTGNHAVK